jgi:hypothetical protein
MSDFFQAILVLNVSEGSVCTGLKCILITSISPGKYWWTLYSSHFIPTLSPPLQHSSLLSQLFETLNSATDMSFLYNRIWVSCMLFCMNNINFKSISYKEWEVLYSQYIWSQSAFLLLQYNTIFKRGSVEILWFKLGLCYFINYIFNVYNYRQDQAEHYDIFSVQARGFISDLTHGQLQSKEVSFRRSTKK